jgi:HlyD family secretion protein
MRMLLTSRAVRGLAVVVLSVGAWGAYASYSGGAPPNVATAVVTKGDYVDIIETRGDIRPLRSIVVTAPYNAGELLILKLVKSGTAVKKDDVLAELDALTTQRLIQDKESELRQARAELDQAMGQARVTADASAATLLLADHDVQRAKLDVHEEDFTAKADLERAKLALLDAEQRLRDAQAKDGATRSSIAADRTMRDRKIAKVQADIDKAKASSMALKVLSPADGTVSLFQNWRNSSPMGNASDFQPGDKIWAGATILELPDVSAVHLSSHIDETDRGQLKAGQSAALRADAIPDREYQAMVRDLSILARADYSSGWPPTKNFDLTLDIKDSDSRLRPGMSATARIAVGRLPDMLLVPVGAVFNIGGRPTVYRLSGNHFQPVVVEVVKRGREQAAIKTGLSAGDRIALVRPDVPPKGAPK